MTSTDVQRRGSDLPCSRPGVLCSVQLHHLCIHPHDAAGKAETAQYSILETSSYSDLHTVGVSRCSEIFDAYEDATTRSSSDLKQCSTQKWGTSLVCFPPSIGSMQHTCFTSKPNATCRPDLSPVGAFLGLRVGLAKKKMGQRAELVSTLNERY